MGVVTDAGGSDSVKPPERGQRRLVICVIFTTGPNFFWVEEWWTGCNCPDCSAPGHWRFLAEYSKADEELAIATANWPVAMYEEIVRRV